MREYGRYLGASLTMLALVGPARAEEQARSAVLVVQPQSALDTKAARDLRDVLSKRGSLLTGSALEARLDRRGQAREEPGRLAEHRELLSRTSRESLEAVANGEYERTLSTSREVFDTIEYALPWLSRDAETARWAGDICLFGVRALLQSGRAFDASARMQQCLRLRPDLGADPELHPDKVRELLASTQNDDRHFGALSVRLEGASSDCIVRSQGRPIRRGSGQSYRLPAGRQRVTVECAGRRGRVHELEVRSGTRTQVTIDVELEAGIAEQDGVLVAEEWLSDAAIGRISKWLDVAEVWWIRAGGSGDSLARVRSDEQGRPVWDVERTKPRQSFVDTAETWIEPATSSDHAPSPAGNPDWLWFGGGASLTLLAGSWLAFGLGERLDAKLDGTPVETDTYGERLRDRDVSYGAALGLNLAGAALGGTSLWFGLPESETVPPWAWIAGGAGVVLSGFGVWRLLEGTELEKASCSEQAACYRLEPATPLASMLLVDGVALMSVPAVLALRSLSSSQNIGVEGGNRGAAVRWSSSW